MFLITLFFLFLYKYLYVYYHNNRSLKIQSLFLKYIPQRRYTELEYRTKWL